MQETMWKDVTLMVVGFVLSIIGALVGAAIQRVIDVRGERRPLNQILNFGNDELLFIFPPRPQEDKRKSLLPLTATEDFMAMNNFISALLNVGWGRKIGFRDPTRFVQADHGRNLVIICSPKSNPVSAKFQEHVLEQRIPAFLFQKRPENDQWFISDGHDEINSRSYKQEQDYEAAGIPRHEFPGKIFDDYAVITKLVNPWNHKNKIILLSGIRAIGTWAAGECIKKEWQQIYDMLPETNKDSDFSALLSIRYDNCDISKIRVIRVLPLGKTQR